MRGVRKRGAQQRPSKAAASDNNNLVSHRKTRRKKLLKLKRKRDLVGLPNRAKHHISAPRENLQLKGGGEKKERRLFKNQPTIRLQIQLMLEGLRGGFKNLPSPTVRKQRRPDP